MERVLVLHRDCAKRSRLREQLAGFAVAEADHLPACKEDDLANCAAMVAGAAQFEGRLAALAKEMPVVVVADAPSVTEAVDCVRAGAADYLGQPFEAGALANALRRALGAEPGRRPPTSPLLGDSAPMRELFDRMAAAGAADAPLLIVGESGSGKALVARAVHDASARRAAPLIAVDCAALAGATADAVIFGAATANASGGLLGAADGGALLLDEATDLPLSAQRKLARVFVAGEPQGAKPPDARLMASSRRDLHQLAAAGHFHEGLLRRLGAYVLRVPPLRDRGDDAVLIAKTVLESSAAKLDKQGLEFADDALDAIRRHAWPGNVRELVNAVERAAALCAEAAVPADLLAPDASPRPPAGAGADAAASGSLERFFVRFVLDNQDQLTETELAGKLGISRKNLWERRQRLNIPRRGTRKRGQRQAGAADA